MMLTSLCSKLAQWQVGPLFVPNWKSLKMAIFHQNNNRDARLFAPNWLSDKLDHFLCQIESRSKWPFFIKTSTATLVSLLQIGSVTSWTTFCAKLKVTQNGHFSSKRQPRRLSLCSKLAQWQVGPLFVPNWKSLKMAIFHQNVNRDARLFAPNWLSDKLDHFLCQIESRSKWPFFIKTSTATLVSLLQIGSVTSWTTFCAKLKVAQNGNFSSKRQPRRSSLCSKLAQWQVGPLFVPNWKSLKMAIFHQNVNRDARLFAPNWLSDKLDHFLCQIESRSKWQFFIKMSTATLVSLLQIGSVTSWTTFCAKLKVAQNGHFSSKRQPRRSSLCSKLAQWQVGPLFVPNWKSLKMAIFHQNINRDARLFARNWLSDKLDHFLCQIESRSKWQFFIKTSTATLVSLLEIGSVTSWTTFCAKLKVAQNGHFSSKRQPRRSSLCSKLAQWQVGPLFVPNWKSLKMAIFHQNVNRDARLFAPNWLSDKLDHFLCQIESRSKWQFFIKMSTATLVSLLQIGSVTSWTTFCAKLKVAQNGHFSSKRQPRRSSLCSKLAQWQVGPLFVPNWKSLKMAIFHQNVNRDARLFAPNWLSDKLDHFLCQIESRSKWPFFIKTSTATLVSLLQIGSVTSWTTFCAKLKVTQNGYFSSKYQPRCSSLCSKLAQWQVGPLFVPNWKSLKMAIFHQNVNRDARLFAPNWLSDKLDHFLCQIESRSKWPFFIKTSTATLVSLLQIGSVTSWTTFCAKLKVAQNGYFSSKH